MCSSHRRPKQEILVAFLPDRMHQCGSETFLLVDLIICRNIKVWMAIYQAIVISSYQKHCHIWPCCCGFISERKNSLLVHTPLTPRRLLILSFPKSTRTSSGSCDIARMLAPLLSTYASDCDTWYRTCVQDLNFRLPKYLIAHRTYERRMSEKKCGS